MYFYGYRSEKQLEIGASEDIIRKHLELLLHQRVNFGIDEQLYSICVFKMILNGMIWGQ